MHPLTLRAYLSAVGVFQSGAKPIQRPLWNGKLQTWQHHVPMYTQMTKLVCCKLKENLLDYLVLALPRSLSCTCQAGFCGKE